MSSARPTALPTYTGKVLHGRVRSRRGWKQARSETLLSSGCMVGAGVLPRRGCWCGRRIQRRGRARHVCLVCIAGFGGITPGIAHGVRSGGGLDAATSWCVGPVAGSSGRAEVTGFLPVTPQFHIFTRSRSKLPMQGGYLCVLGPTAGILLHQSKAKVNLRGRTRSVEVRLMDRALGNPSTLWPFWTD